MSAPPDPQDLLLAGTAERWAAAGAEQYAAGAALRDGDGAQQREQLAFGSAREHPPVAMATASPGKRRGVSADARQRGLAAAASPASFPVPPPALRPALLLENTASELVSAYKRASNRGLCKLLSLLWWGRGAQDPAKFPEAFYYLLGKGFPVFSRIVGRHLVAVQLGGAPSSFVLHLYMSRESDRLQSYFTYSLHT